MDSKTDEIIEEHQFTEIEQWTVFIFTLISACSLIAVIVALIKTHSDRGSDIVLTAVAALCFVIYRACLAFGIESEAAAQYVFLPADSWHKLSNIFMLIEYCSVIIFLARIPKEKEGYLLAMGTAIVIILQEKDSFTYMYALIPLIFNNLILICSSMIFESAGSFNTQMVVHGALWYVISCIGFVFTFSETLDYYFLFDDLFMVSTAFSLFYSWQSYELDTVQSKATIGLADVPSTLRSFAIGCRDQARANREKLSLQAKELVAGSPLGQNVTKLGKKAATTGKAVRNKKNSKKKHDDEIDLENDNEAMEMMTDNNFDLETNSRTTLNETQDTMNMKRRTRKRKDNESDSDENDGGNYALDSFMQSDEGGT